MSRRATGSLLPVVFGASVYFHPASAQQFPPRSQLRPAPPANGRRFLPRCHAVPSSVKFLHRGFQEIAPFFVHRAKAGGRTTRRRPPITGPACARIGGSADTRTGTRRDMNLGYRTEIVQRLNQQEGRDRYREIPLQDLSR